MQLHICVEFGIQTPRTFGDMAPGGQIACNRNLENPQGNNSAILPSIYLNLAKAHSHTQFYICAKFELILF